MDIGTLLIGFIISGNIDFKKVIIISAISLIVKYFSRILEYIESFRYPVSYTVSLKDSGVLYNEISYFLKNNFSDSVLHMMPKLNYGMCDDNRCVSTTYSFTNNISFTIKYNNSKVKVTPVIIETSKYCDSLIKLCFINKKELNDFINSAKEIYKLKSDDNKIYNINTDMSFNNWSGSKYLIGKNFSNTFIEKELLKNIRKNIDNFLKRKNNPKFSGLPNKLGFIFYGEPGNGKTSVAVAIANEYNRRIYQLDKNSIDTKKINQYMRSIKPGNILLVNEADIIFSVRNKKISNNNISNESDNIKKILDEENIKIPESDYKNSLKTQLYEIFDGYNYLEDTIIILTTNNLEEMDQTLIRPGRIDYKYEVKKPTLETLKDIYKFYTDADIEIDNINKELCNKSVSEIISTIISQDINTINSFFYKN